MKAFFLCICFVSSLCAQQVKVSGIVRDGATNEPLPLANVLVRGTTTGTTSNETGKFLLSLSPGEYELLVSFIGYKTETMPLSIKNNDIVLNVKLFPTDILLQEVTVYSTPTDKANETEVSSLSLQSKRISEITSVMSDVLRSVQALPGISANNEFSAKFNVRGGNYDENLVLVNGAQVYEPFHVKEAPNASIGIFNTDLIRKMDLSTGGFSARYGDRMSSVLNIEYREGNKEHYSGAATLSLTDLNAFVEGPLGQDGSFIIGGRKSYLEYVLSFLDVEKNAHPSFYDIQGVFTYTLTPKNKLQAEFIHAGDRFLLDPFSDLRGPYRFNTQFKNQLSTVFYNTTNYEEQNSRYFSNLFDVQSTNFLSGNALLKAELSYYDQLEEEYTFTFFDYVQDIRSDQTYFYKSRNEHLRKNDLRIKTLEGKTSLDIQLSPTYEIRTGFSYQNIAYTQTLFDRRMFTEAYNYERYPDTTLTQSLNADNTDEAIETRSFKLAGYIENIIQASDNLIFNIGGRIDYFDFNKDWNISPRISASYQTAFGTTLRAAWGFYYQSPIYRQLAYSVASDTNTHAQKAIHYILSAEHTFLFDPLNNNSLKIKIEGYYKRYDNLISSTQASSGRISYSRKNDATGWANGIDLYIVLNASQFYGWISYGLLHAKEDLNNDTIGEYARYTDQRHTFAFVGDVSLGARWSLNMRIYYGSGYAFTPYTSRYNSSAKRWEWILGSKNSAYLPAYNRVDVRLSKEFEIGSLAVLAFLDVNNLFNAKNIQSYRYRFNNNGSPYVEEVALWPIVPTLGMTIKF
ncbi:MAG: TonB-dependent receptor [Ignavibacteriales bacterium]|nr:TonB-dependent receptor [Ignavibacteriales bacterium]